MKKIDLTTASGRKVDNNQNSFLSENEQKDLVANIAGSLSKATKEIQALQISHFKKADMEYGTEIEKNL